MTIKLVFNGYYRSGTSIMWWIIKRSNPKILHLYEPLAPKWLEKVENYIKEGYHFDSPLPIWEDYYHSEFQKIKDEYVKAWLRIKNQYTMDILPRDVHEIAPLLDILEQVNTPVVLQTNRFHLILRGVSEHYQCRFIHIIRNPIDIWFSHSLKPLTRLNKVKARYIPIKPFVKYISKILYKNRDSRITKWLILHWPDLKGTRNAFYLDSVHILVSNYFKFPPAKDNLDKLLINWAVLNHSAWQQSKSGRGMIVYYESLVKHPERYFKHMEQFAHIKCNLEYAKELTSRSITESEELKEIFLQRLEKLGLLDLVEEMYPPEKWFG